MPGLVYTYTRFEKQTLFNLGTIRQNQQDNLNVKIDQTDENKKKEELKNFIKNLVHNGGDTDLSTATDTIENIKNNKHSLFPLCIFFEQLVSVSHIDY